jgi:hypothetical protein
MSFFTSFIQSSWKKIALLALVLLAILFMRHFPRYYALMSPPSGYEFSGQLALYDPEDINIYVAAIKYGQAGNLMLDNQFSAADSGEALIYPVYTILGYSFRTVDPYLLFNLAAIVTGASLCLVIFYLANKVFHNYWYSLLTMFLVPLGGGFGWLLQDKIISADLAYSGIRFSTALQRAHEGIGTLLYVVAVSMYFYVFRESKIKSAVISFIAAYLLIIFYPYYIVNYVAIVGLYTLYYSFKHKSFKHVWLVVIHGAIIIIGCLLYYFHLSQSGFSSDLSESPGKIGIIPLVLGYGVFVALFIPLFSLKQKNKQMDEQIYYIFWIVISIGLSYSPIDVSRFFLRGLFYPLVMLTLIKARNLFNITVRKMIILTLIIFLPLTALFVFSKRIQVAGSYDSWTYMPVGIVEGLEALDKIDEGNVFASYELSNKVPAFTNNKVFFGAIAQAKDPEERYNEISLFYSGRMTDVEAKNLLMKNNIKYILYGPGAAKLGGHLYPFLKLIYRNNTIRIYTY